MRRVGVWGGEEREGEGGTNLPPSLVTFKRPGRETRTFNRAPGGEARTFIRAPGGRRAHSNAAGIQRVSCKTWDHGKLSVDNDFPPK